MIKTHNDLLNKLYNIENPDFYVFQGETCLVIETVDNNYIIKPEKGGYSISLNHNYAQTVSKDKPYKKVENTVLIQVDTPQEVFDYFKPFMK